MTRAATSRPFQVTDPQDFAVSIRAQRRTGAAVKAQRHASSRGFHAATIEAQRPGRPGTANRPGLLHDLALGAAIAAVAVYVRPWATTAPPDSRKAQLSRGSILFVPLSGDICRQRTIDNSTWRIHDGGPVDCSAALANESASDVDGRWSGSRVDIIRDAFRNRP